MSEAALQKMIERKKLVNKLHTLNRYKDNEEYMKLLYETDKLAAEARKLGGLTTEEKYLLSLGYTTSKDHK